MIDNKNLTGDRERNMNRIELSPSDRINEVYGGVKPSGIVVLTVILSVLMVIFSVLSIIFTKYYLLWIFVPVLAVLIISTIIRKKNEKKYRPEEHTNHTEAIFKDYDI